jgi:hypothetical protein
MALSPLPPHGLALLLIAAVPAAAAAVPADSSEGGSMPPHSFREREVVCLTRPRGGMWGVALVTLVSAPAFSFNAHLESGGGGGGGYGPSR